MIQGLYGFLAEAAALAPASSGAVPPALYVVGHGHRRFARAGLQVSAAEALALLRYDLFEIETILSAMVPEGTQICQFDALASLAHDIGLARLAGSRAWERFRAGDWIAAADGFDEWRGPGLGLVGDLPAQALRRATEKANFLCAEFPLELPAFGPHRAATIPIMPASRGADGGNLARAGIESGAVETVLETPEAVSADPEVPAFEIHVGAAARRGIWPEEPEFPPEPPIAPRARVNRRVGGRPLVGALGAIGLAAGGVWMILEGRLSGPSGRWAGLAAIIGATLLVLVFARKGGGALLRLLFPG